jgi:Spy/CpxP family protein refolding chaperone
MKKIFLTIMVVAGISMFANAQTKAHKTPEEKAQHATQMLQKKLALSADQSAKVNAIFLKRAKQADSLKATKPAGERRINRQAFKAIAVNTNAQLNAVLTADQQKAYTALKAERKGKMHGRHANPEQRAQRMTKVLENKLALSADQSAKVNAILLKRVTEMHSLKAKGADRTANKEARKAIMVKADADLKAVLTADQQKNYTELKNQLKERMKNRKAGKGPSVG